MAILLLTCSAGAQSGWSIQTVDSAENVGQYTSLALDSSDNPHISYYDGSNKYLKYAEWAGNDWVKKYVGWDQVGDSSSLALDSSNNPHISYYTYSFDNDFFGLAHAELEYQTGHQGGDVWNIKTVDSVWGEPSSLALDSSDNPHISYYDNGDMKYAKWTGSTWIKEIVDSKGDVGKYTSLALDSSDNPHISYYDRTEGNLKYAAVVGSISVATFPSGAEVFVDGVPMGTASPTLTVSNLVFGPHNVTCTLSGYLDNETRVNVPVPDPLMIPLSPAVGSISVTSTPSGAEVSVDGVTMGTAPQTVSNLAFGPHNVTCTLSGYLDCDITVNVTAGELEPVKCTLVGPPKTPRILSGAIYGVTETYYECSAYATDPDGDKIEYTFDWGDDTISTIHDADSGVTVSKSHSWERGGNYSVKVKATDINGDSSDWSDPISVEISGNRAPDTPRLSGESSVKPNTNCRYSANTTDPEGDKIKYTFDWDDDTDYATTQLVDSGTSQSRTHVWEHGGIHYVKVKATDEYEHSSDWSDPIPVEVEVPWYERYWEFIAALIIVMIPIIIAKLWKERR
ncbi:PEGA domain-containing protein [Methanolobus sp. ZRKC3]|uniref:PEGA domain-containing protein n=1 Tax=Methanolobus sp. ZRKC3 TaxID=3125786 RepID=UPI00324E0091